MGWKPGLGEIIIILVIVILLFGAKRIPEIARSLGRSLSEFKKGQKEGESGASENPDGDKTAGPKT